MVGFRRAVAAGLVAGGIGASAQAVEPAIPRADPPAPAAPTSSPAPAADACPAGGDSDFWRNVPPVRPMPRLGNFPVPPGGPGYYSLADALAGDFREKPPKFPYPPFGLIPQPFFDADFRYLDDPKNTQFDWADPLHRMRPGDDWLFATGGDARFRYAHEGNSRLTTTDNTYGLPRVRAYADLWYRDECRVFVEGVWADSLWQDLAPLPPDINRGDLQNAFVDLKLPWPDDHPAYLRLGRQELILGSQRLVGIPDWLNDRRTFQGARILRTGEQFDFDLFWLQPVVPDPNRLDSVDNNVNFAGAWATYRPRPGTSIDLYYLFLDNTNRTTQLGVARNPVTLHTIGTRWAGDVDGAWLYDFEAAGQCGDRGAQTVRAGMATAGLGYHFADVPCNPTLWAYYDWASGDNTPGRGRYATFTQLFPFGHYYLGWIDVVGRQNIRDFNLHLYLYPDDWITVWTQYHCFQLDQPRDALYNAAGVAIRRDPTGRAGRDVGQEGDWIVNFHLSPHSDLLTGYSKLWGGGFLERTANRTRSADSDLCYVQYSFRW
jgi:Alginate export